LRAPTSASVLEPPWSGDGVPPVEDGEKSACQARFARARGTDRARARLSVRCARCAHVRSARRPGVWRRHTCVQAPWHECVGRKSRPRPRPRPSPHPARAWEVRARTMAVMLAGSIAALERRRAFGTELRRALCANKGINVDLREPRKSSSSSTRGAARRCLARRRRCTRCTRRQTRRTNERRAYVVVHARRRGPRHTLENLVAKLVSLDRFVSDPS